jgi:NADPH:quinone reductase-like Zn-dependent oxidoreductase
MGMRDGCGTSPSNTGTEDAMRSWWMRIGDDETALELRDVARPEPGPRQLRVRLRAAALNRGEFLRGHGLHAANAWKAIGGEGAGEVEAVGAEVSGFRVGDRVMGRCTGAFAEAALMEAAEAMPKPGVLSWEEAAGLPLVYLVAFDMLVLQGRLAAGERLLIAGVSSGVGVASLQLGKALGAHVFGTSGSEAKLAALKRMGLELGLPSHGFAPAVLKATGGQGADLAVNAIGGSAFAECVRALTFEGRLAMVGLLDGVLQAELDLATLHAKRLALFGVSNKLRTPAQRAAAVPQFVAEVLPHVAAGRIRPHLDRVVPFERLPEAKAAMEGGAHVGKIVLRMPD